MKPKTATEAGADTNATSRSAAPLRTAFGRRLRMLRHHRVMSQKSLAVTSGVSMNTIGSIERGLRFPSPEVLESLARALDVEVRDLFDTGEHSTPVTLEGAARELCRIVDAELLPQVEKLTDLATRLLEEANARTSSAARTPGSTGGDRYEGSGLAVAAAS